MPTEIGSQKNDGRTEGEGDQELSLSAVVLLGGEALGAARASYPDELGGLDGLARALATSPIWGTPSRAALVLRTGSDPFMAVLGYLDAATRARLDAMRSHLSLALRTLRYVDYEQAERDSARLAEQLEARLGRDYLDQCYFAALPRGGFIVLGMLSYTLGLKSNQLQPAPPDAPLVLVDDCALTGSHFRATLQELPQTEITFATLYAHPDLRTALERHERVKACVSAHDLQDHAPQHLGADYATWRARWDARTGRDWVGIPDHVCFAWNEPEVALWNVESQAVERGWQLLPPSTTRPEPESEMIVLPVQSHGEGSGHVRLAPRVAFADLGAQVIVCDVDTGEAVGLTALAADVARALLVHVTTREAAEAVAASHALTPSVVVAQVEQVVQRLAAHDLLLDDGAFSSDG